MPFNTEQIVQDIRTEFESMLAYVTDGTAKTADQAERELFKRLLGLGAQLLLLFFHQRAASYPHTPVKTEDGAELPYRCDKKRNYYSIFGKLPLWRPYFYAQDGASASPLDAELSLGGDCYSDLLREVAEYLGVDVTYEKVSDIFGRLLGRALSTQAIQTLVADDAADVTAYYEQKPASDADSEASILIIQSDGKGVPMVRETAVEAKVRLSKGEKRASKKEAVVTAVYTLAPMVRTPAEVVNSFFHKEKAAHSCSTKRSKPQNKHVWATLTGKDAALQRLAKQVAIRDGAHIQQRVALTDGCEALQQRMRHYFPQFTLILDFIHANEYLWKAANSLFGEDSPARDPWVEQQTLHILSGQTQQVITHLRSLAQKAKRTKTQRAALETAANYFQRNQSYMHYDHYLAQGWPIASGVIEGACRHFVKDRFELSGMRWTKQGAENLLLLRAVAENGDWDDYHRFRRQQRHLRLYNSPFPDQRAPEQQALAKPTSSKVIRFDQAVQRRRSQHQQPQQRLAA